MKLINIVISKFIVTDDLEIKVYFWKWVIAKFRVEVLTGEITRI